MALTHHPWRGFEYQWFAALRRMEGANVADSPVDGVTLDVRQATSRHSELFWRDRQRGQRYAVKALGVGEEGGVALRAHFSDDFACCGHARCVVLLGGAAQ